MIKGKLDNGFEFEIEEKRLDMRFVEKLAEADDNFLLFPSIAEEMLGKEQKEALYSFLEDEEGHVPVPAFVDAITEIFDKAGGAVKN